MVDDYTPDEVIAQTVITMYHVVAGRHYLSGGCYGDLLFNFEDTIHRLPDYGNVPLHCILEAQVVDKRFEHLRTSFQE